MAQTDTSLNKYRIYAGWYDFTEDTIFLENDSFLLKHKNLIGYSDNETFELQDSITDTLGFKHETYNVYHAGFPIIDFQLMIHSYSGFITVINGDIPIDIGETSGSGDLYPLASARQKAIDSCYGSQFAWEDSDWEDSLTFDTIFSGTTGSFFPEGRLVYYIQLNQENSLEYNLCYLFQITRLAPSYITYNLLIDAFTGDLILKQEYTRTCNGQSGTATTSFDGSQGMNVASRLGNYRLEDCSRNIEARWIDWKAPDVPKAWWKLNNITDNNGHWGTGDQMGTTPYWGIQKSWDYFSSKYGVKAFGSKNKICISVNWPALSTSYDPFYSDKEEVSMFYVGQFNGQPQATLDIMGHEYTHSIVHRISKLGGINHSFGETAALEESISDIFGILISNYFKGNASMDWSLGKDQFGATGIRNLATGASANTVINPLQPLYMSDSRFKPSGINDPDDGGKHTNCGVPSKWFQLLTDGGTQRSVTVYGIGKDAAANIVYRAVDLYTPNTAKFVDFKIATMKAAEDIYGKCSFELRMVIRGWHAVEVFAGSSTGLNCLFITGPKILCRNVLPKTLNYSVTACINGATSPIAVVWSPPSNWTYNSLYNQVITFTNQSPYTSTSIGATVSISGGSPLSVQKNIKVDQANVKCLVFKGYKDEYLGKRTLSNDIDQVEIFNIYPNPAQNSITFNFQSERQIPIKIKVYNSVGKEIYNSIFYNNSGEIDTERFANGLYNFTAEIGIFFTSKNLFIHK